MKNEWSSQRGTLTPGNIVSIKEPRAEAKTTKRCKKPLLSDEIHNSPKKVPSRRQDRGRGRGRKPAAGEGNPGSRGMRGSSRRGQEGTGRSLHKGRGTPTSHPGSEPGLEDDVVTRIMSRRGGTQADTTPRQPRGARPAARKVTPSTALSGVGAHSPSGVGGPPHEPPPCEGHLPRPAPEGLTERNAGARGVTPWPSRKRRPVGSSQEPSVAEAGRQNTGSRHAAACEALSEPGSRTAAPSLGPRGLFLREFPFSMLR